MEGRKVGLTKEQAIDALHELVWRIGPKEKWLVAAWAVDGGRLMMTDRVTFQFPTGDFLPAVGQLAAGCHDEALACQNELPSTPLPLAKVGVGEGNVSEKGSDGRPAVLRYPVPENVKDSAELPPKVDDVIPVPPPNPPEKKGDGYQ